MTKEAQRIAIAEACGWHWNGRAYVKGNEIARRWEMLPDYPDDLNAMHEAEKVLQDKCKYWPDYIDELSKLFRVGFPQQDATNWSQMCHATAAQRAEAFLRTLGKFVD